MLVSTQGLKAVRICNWLNANPRKAIIYGWDVAWSTCSYIVLFNIIFSNCAIKLNTKIKSLSILRTIIVRCGLFDHASSGYLSVWFLYIYFIFGHSPAPHTPGRTGGVILSTYMWHRMKLQHSYLQHGQACSKSERHLEIGVANCY